MNRPVSDMLIDITRLLDRKLQGKIPTGVDRVGLAYIEHFANHAQALVRYGVRWVILSHASSQRLFNALLNPDKNCAWLIRYHVGWAYIFNWKSYKAGMTLLNVVHSGLEHPRYAREIRRRKLKPVFFLHDLIPITHPEYCRPEESQKHKQRLQTMLSTGVGIIMNSIATQEALNAFAHGKNIALPPALIAPLAPAKLLPPLTMRPIPKPYFVVLGTIEPRKNHLLLLNIWRELAHELGEDAPRLVIIGRRGWECEQVADMLDRCEPIKKYIIEKPDCKDAELSTWLMYARALLFPSFAEGFGIPLTEALMLGVPVIASDLNVFHEIAGKIPEYISPIDAIGWKRSIIEYASENSSQYKQQRQRMEGYKAPTWQSHFIKVDAFLTTLVGANP